MHKKSHRIVGVSHYKQLGMSLIELVLSMAITLFLLVFLMGLFLSTETSYRLQMDLMAIQENAKTAIIHLNSEIKKAGQIGCARLSNNFPMQAYESYSLSSSNQLIGTESSITLRYGHFSGSTLIKGIQSKSILYSTLSFPIFKQGDILIISDCKHAELFQAEAVVKLKDKEIKIMSSRPLYYDYDRTAEIGRFEVNTFFIKKTSRNYPNKMPIYSLYLQGIHEDKKELVEGITAMKIHYDLMENGKLITKKASEIHNWSDLAGIAIDFTASSMNLEKEWHDYISLRGGLA